MPLFSRITARDSSVPNWSGNFPPTSRPPGKIATADPNPHHVVDWGKVTAVKPNRSEALQAAGLPVTDPIDPPLEDKALLTAGIRLLSAWDTEMLLITLG
jgi:bifunctional ADP-heptose synthase (sugar kinase/adenylyltransferase)